MSTLSDGGPGGQERKSDPSNEKPGTAPLSCIEGTYCNAETYAGSGGVSRISEFEQIVLQPVKCQCQWCPECCVREAVILRERLRPVVQQWSRARMVTLSIDRKKWPEGPRHCWQTLQAKRRVWCFVKKLVRRKLLVCGDFFYVIEFHPSSPEWFHYHIAFRADGRWPNKFDRDWPRFQNMLAQLWGHGFAQASDETKTSCPEHAMNYLTKYVAKQDVGPPSWIRDGSVTFRKFSTSRGLIEPPKKRKPKKTNRVLKKRRPPSEIIANCRKKSRMMKVNTLKNEYIGGTDEIKVYRYQAQIDVPLEELAKDEKFLRSHLGDSWEIKRKITKKKKSRPAG